jgi:hypothetical protein
MPRSQWEYGNGIIAINPKHTKLITVLRTAVEKEEETLDKEVTSHNEFRCIQNVTYDLAFVLD